MKTYGDAYVEVLQRLIEARVVPETDSYQRSLKDLHTWLTEGDEQQNAGRWSMILLYVVMLRVEAPEMKQTMDEMELSLTVMANLKASINFEALFGPEPTSSN